LVAFRFPEIENEIKTLYDHRSDFVHGSFFLRIKKSIKVDNGLAHLPTPPFAFLYKQKENIRHALAAYLILNKIYRSKPADFKECQNVLDLREQSIIDLDLRAKVQQHTAMILDLM